MKTISPNELSKLQQQQEIELIDVRTPIEYRGVHASSARNVPLDSIDPANLMNARNGLSGQPLYVICHSGARAAKACQKLIDAGYAEVVNVEGGTQAWEQAGLPVVRGKAVMSLERQVRLTAGVIVFVGGCLTLAVHPWFAVIPTLIGAGLAFAAITNTCAMGMMLAKMPWNQGEDNGGSCSV